MKPYGLPRFSWLDYPDVEDIHYFGLKSSIGNIKRHGEFRGIHRNKISKTATRRFWKRKARAKAKKEINNEVADYQHHKYCECEECEPKNYIEQVD